MLLTSLRAAGLQAFRGVQRGDFLAPPQECWAAAAQSPRNLFEAVFSAAVSSSLPTGPGSVVWLVLGRMVSPPQMGSCHLA